jgi:hypothetical protein
MSSEPLATMVELWQKHYRRCSVCLAFTENITPEIGPECLIGNAIYLEMLDRMEASYE